MTRAWAAGVVAAAVLLTGAVAGCAGSSGPRPTTSTTADLDELSAPLLKAGVVNTTLDAVRVTGVDDAGEVVGHLSPDLQGRVSVGNLPAGHDGWELMFATGTSKAEVAEALETLRRVYGDAQASSATVTVGAATFRAPLTEGAAYVKAIALDDTAPASTGTMAGLDKLVRGGWHIAVDRERSELVLAVSVQRALTDAVIEKVRALMATESGSTAQLVRVVPGLPDHD